MDDVNPFEPLITNDSLIDTGRVSRRPVLTWLDNLLARTRAIDAVHLEASMTELSPIQNNYSLLTMILLGVEAARDQCLAQISFAQRLNRLDEAVQPWINLARIDRLSGNVRGAQKLLAPVGRLARHARASVGTVRHAASDSERRFVASVYAIEAFHCAVGSPSKLRQYFRWNAHLLGGEIHPLVAEQAVIGGTLVGDEELLQRGLASRAWFTDMRTRLVGMYYRAAYAFLSGDNRLVRRFALELIRQVPLASSFQLSDHAIQRLLHRGGVLAATAKCREAAYQLFLRSYRYAELIDDVEYRVRSLCCLAKLMGGEPTPVDSWRSLAEHSGYRRFSAVPHFQANSDVLAKAFQLHGLVGVSLSSLRGDDPTSRVAPGA